MNRGIVAVLLGFGAILSAMAGFLLTGTSSIGMMVFSFLSPVLALVGIIVAAMEMSAASERGDSTGTAIAALVLNVIAFLVGLFIALTCGICGACVSAGGTSGQRQINDVNRQLNKAMEEAAQKQRQRANRAQDNDSMALSAAAVQHLTDACAEQWCTGTYNYEFSGMTCQNAECQIAFTARHAERPPTTTSVTIPRSVVGGPPDRFDTPFNDAVAKAINAWEAAQGI